MCTLSGETTRKTTGYKVLAVDAEGNFYSTFTGQMIGVGKVPLPPMKCKRMSGIWSSALNYRDLHFWPFYNSKFEGKTGLYIHKTDAVLLFKEIKYDWDSGYKPVLVKVKFKGTVYLGDHSGDPIIACDFIEKIEILKTPKT